MKSCKNQAPPRDKGSEGHGWKIRALQESDLETVLAIERMSFPSPWTKMLFQQEINNPVSHFWVVEKPGVPRSIGPIGYLCFWMLRDEVQIMNLAIHPRYRRGGIARWLLDRAFKYAKQRGLSRVVLEVRKSNLAAMNLYRSMQFQRVGTRPGYYRDTGEDAFVMMRKLKPIVQ
jgi:ribosomal-protein-alanine N-acetyltransferase